MPVLKLDLHLADQFAAPQFFISGLILVYSWAFSGTLTAVILTILSTLVVLYMGLGLKEPALFLQTLTYAALFLFIVSYLQKIQNRSNDKRILKENLLEKIHLAEQEFAGKISRKKAFENKIHRLLDLHRFSEELKDLGDVRLMGERIVQEAAQSLEPTHECALYLVDEVKEELSWIAGLGSNQTETNTLSRGTLYDQWVMKRSQGLVIEDSRNEFRFHMDLSPGAELRRSICASPLLSENRVLGVIRLSSPEPHLFHADDLRLLDIFAGIGAVNLHNVLLYQKMRELAIRDSLTGLYLNRHFMEELTSEIRKAQFDKSEFSLILLDIDFFKQYNDDYGHVVGDIVLKNIAATIAETARRERLIAARYGGEEFALLLPRKGKIPSLRIAEILRYEIEQNRFSPRRAERHVTASLGVATFPSEGRTREEILWKTDQHLYAAKLAGRNRVCGNT